MNKLLVGNDQIKIQKVETYHLGRSRWAELWEREKDLPLTTPLDNYPEYKQSLSAWYSNPAFCLVVLVGDNGQEGLGWTEDGCKAVKSIIDHHLSRFVVGRSPFEVEKIWDVMFRASIPYGRKGAAIEAISAVDIAMWDLMGKVTRRPVYELLGGACREKVPLYASALHPVGEQKVVEEARAYVRDGFTAMKARFTAGPPDGPGGMRANVKHLQTIREAIGPEVKLAADAYMGWDIAYGVSMCRLLEPLQLAWIEEPVIPDDIAGYAAIRRSTPIPISGGEHEFSRWGFQQLFEADAVDIAQPDLHRCGGFTEARKIAAMASLRGLQVINHTYSVPHVHFSIATPNCPLLEYFPTPCWAPPLPTAEPLFVGEPLVEGGAVRPTDEPGLGLQLNRSRLKELSNG